MDLAFGHPACAGVSSLVSHFAWRKALTILRVLHNVDWSTPISVSPRFFCEMISSSGESVVKVVP